MRNEKQLIALHREMRKTAFERVGEPLAKAIEVKLGEQPKEEPDARPGNAR